MKSRRSLIIFVVVDVVLVVLLVVVALNRGGGSDGTASNPGSAGSAGPSSSASSTSTQPTDFQLPSGNIACTMSVDGATCTIASYTYAEPVVAGCTDVTGHVIVLNTDGVAFPCVSGPPPAVADQSVPVLEYGQKTSVGDYTCTSSTEGVTCVDGSGVGFQLARAKWSELPAT